MVLNVLFLLFVMDDNHSVTSILRHWLATWRVLLSALSNYLSVFLPLKENQLFHLKDHHLMQVYQMSWRGSHKSRCPVVSHGGGNLFLYAIFSRVVSSYFPWPCWSDCKFFKTQRIVALSTNPQPLIHGFPWWMRNAQCCGTYISPQQGEQPSRMCWSARMHL